MPLGRCGILNEPSSAEGADWNDVTRAICERQHEVALHDATAGGAGYRPTKTGGRNALGGKRHRQLPVAALLQLSGSRGGCQTAITSSRFSRTGNSATYGKRCSSAERLPSSSAGSPLGERLMRAKHAPTERRKTSPRPGWCSSCHMQRREDQPRPQGIARSEGAIALPRPEAFSHFLPRTSALPVLVEILRAPIQLPPLRRCQRKRLIFVLRGDAVPELFDEPHALRGERLKSSRRRALVMALSLPPGSSCGRPGRVLSGRERRRSGGSRPGDVWRVTFAKRVARLRSQTMATRFGVAAGGSRARRWTLATRMRCARSGRGRQASEPPRSGSGRRAGIRRRGRRLRQDGAPPRGRPLRLAVPGPWG